VDDNPSCELQGAKVFQPSAGAMSERVINESRPGNRKEPTEA